MLRHGNDVLSGVSQVDRTLPCHHSKNVQRQQNTPRMNLSIGTLQEIGDDLGALRLCWMICVLGLKIETCILLVAFGRETHVVKLHFIHARLRPELRQGNVVILHLCIDRKSTRLNSSHLGISYAVFCLKKKNNKALLTAGRRDGKRTSLPSRHIDLS